MEIDRHDWSKPMNISEQCACGARIEISNIDTTSTSVIMSAEQQVQRWRSRHNSCSPRTFESLKRALMKLNKTISKIQQDVSHLATQ